jgi:hypothetical protein
MKSPCCLWVNAHGDGYLFCARARVWPAPPCTLFLLINRLTDFYETWYRRHVIRGHSTSYTFNFLHSVITTLRQRGTCGVGPTLAPLNIRILEQSMLREILNNMQLFGLLPLFWKNKCRTRSPCCLCIPPINFWMPEPNFMKLGMHIMAPGPISTEYS